MTDNDKKLIGVYRSQGLGYKRIAAVLGLSVNAVKCYFRRHPVEKRESACEQCGKTVVQAPHRKKKRFCSDACRMKWWYAHKDRMRVKKLYEHTCRMCGIVFTDQYKDRTYCSRACFADARRKGRNVNE